MTTANTALQATGAAVGGVASSQTQLAQRAESLLVSLGYSPSQARQMVESAQRDVHGTLQGQTPMATDQAKAQAQGALNTVIDWSAGLGWSWFGTWFVSGILAILGGMWVSRRLQRYRDDIVGSPGSVSPHPAGPVT